MITSPTKIDKRRHLYLSKLYYIFPIHYRSNQWILIITNHTVSFHKLRSMLGMTSHGTRGLLTSVTWKTRSWITETSSLLSQRTRANVVFLMVFSWGWDNPPVSSSYQSLSPVLNKKMLTVGSWDQTRTKDNSFF